MSFMVISDPDTGETLEVIGDIEQAKKHRTLGTRSHWYDEQDKLDEEMNW